MSLAKSILFLAFALSGRIAPVAAALSTQQEVLVSTSPKLTVYSCFLNNNDVKIENDNGKTDDEEVASRQACCKSIQSAWKKIEEWRSNSVGSIFSFPMDQCLLELADVPKASKEMANFAWTLPVIPSSESADPPHKQFLFNHQRSMEPIQTSSPFHKSTNNEQQPMISVPITSHLDPNGGMHRLLHHSTTLLRPDEINRYLLYVVVPSGMFVDLDDALEVVDTANSHILTAKAAEPLPEARCAFSLSQDDEAVATIHLHAAKTCDIEQPAFVSGQHLLVWEIHVQGSNASIPLQLATKLHLRYPQPSQSMEQWIDLPKPMLFGYLEQNTNEEDLHKFKRKYELPDEWQLEVLDPVWVAAGNNDDHDWVMGITMASCLIGVAWMLRDISRVSMWDDV